MNLDSSLAFFVNQGPIFWAAAAAVGAGGALLITSLFVILRRAMSNLAVRPRIALPNLRKARSARKAGSETSETGTAARPAIQVTDTGYALAGAGGAAESPDPTANGELSALLERLKTAGNHLEETIRGTAGTERPYSPLKAPAATVEYETRVGVG